MLFRPLIDWLIELASSKGSWSRAQASARDAVGPQRDAAKRQVGHHLLPVGRETIQSSLLAGRPAWVADQPPASRPASLPARELARSDKLAASSVQSDLAELVVPRACSWLPAPPPLPVRAVGGRQVDKFALAMRGQLDRALAINHSHGRLTRAEGPREADCTRARRPD